MNKKYNAAGLMFGLATWVLISVVVVYSGVQADKIDALNDALAQQELIIDSLTKEKGSENCVVADSDKEDQWNQATSNEPQHLPTPAQTAKSNVRHASELAYTEYPDQSNTDDESSGNVDPQAVRAFFKELFHEADIAGYSDEELLNEGSALLEQYIANEESDFESSLSAAYALNELTDEAIPEHLSQSLLHKASQSDNEDQLMDTLLLIGDQQYSESSLLAADLMASTSADARMVGIYLLATDQESGQSSAVLANELYANPEETIEILGNLIGE